MAAAQDVQVEVVHRLAAIGAGVDDDTVAFCVKTFHAGDFGGCFEQVAEELAMLNGGLGVGGDVVFGNQQQVGGSLGINIRKAE